MIDARRFGIGLGVAAGAIAAAALAGSPLANADVDEPGCTADLCGTAYLLGPYDFTSVSIPADDYSNIGSFMLGPDGITDATGYVITSGTELPGANGLTDFPGIAGETLLYTDVGGVVGAPTELLPFDLPL
jgi:hypothetical protein